MTTSVNQTRQLYVVTTAGGLKTPTVVASDKAGSIAVKADTNKSHLYFQYKGAANIMRSDLIDTENILSITVADAAKARESLKSVLVTVNADINGGNPVVGQDYLLRIAFRQYVGMSDEDQYFKYGVAHAYSGMSMSELYKVLATSLAKNFSRELYPLLDVYLVDKNTSASTTQKVAVLKNGVEQTLEALEEQHEYTGIVLDEVEQEWVLGVKQQVPVYFDVFPATIMVDGDEVIWGKAEKTTPAGTINNGKKIADLEYFCMGERGDQYRNIGWPRVIPTTYLVDPTLEYNTIDIHYAWVGANESVQKSEKTITLVVPKVGANNKTANALANSIITAINTATGKNIALLDISE